MRLLLLFGLFFFFRPLERDFEFAFFDELGERFLRFFDFTFREDLRDCLRFDRERFKLFRFDPDIEAECLLDRERALRFFDLERAADFFLLVDFLRDFLRLLEPSREAAFSERFTDFDPARGNGVSDLDRLDKKSTERLPGDGCITGAGNGERFLLECLLADRLHSDLPPLLERPRGAEPPKGW